MQVVSGQAVDVDELDGPREGEAADGLGALEARLRPADRWPLVDVRGDIDRIAALALDAVWPE